MNSWVNIALSLYLLTIFSPMIISSQSQELFPIEGFWNLDGTSIRPEVGLDSLDDGILVTEIGYEYSGFKAVYDEQCRVAIISYYIFDLFNPKYKEARHYTYSDDRIYVEVFWGTKTVRNLEYNNQGDLQCHDWDIDNVNGYTRGGSCKRYDEKDRLILDSYHVDFQGGAGSGSESDITWTFYKDDKIDSIYYSTSYSDNRDGRSSSWSKEKYHYTNGRLDSITGRHSDFYQSYNFPNPVPNLPDSSVSIRIYAYENFQLDTETFYYNDFPVERINYEYNLDTVTTIKSEYTKIDPNNPSTDYDWRYVNRTVELNNDSFALYEEYYWYWPSEKWIPRKRETNETFANCEVSISYETKEGNWAPQDKEKTMTDNSGNIILRERSEYNNEEWILTYKDVFLYNENNDLLFLENYIERRDSFILFRRNTYDYDQNFNLSSRASYLFNLSTNQVEKKDSTFYLYYPDGLLEQQISVDNNGIHLDTTEWSYNEYGLPLRQKHYKRDTTFNWHYYSLPCYSSSKETPHLGNDYQFGITPNPMEDNFVLTFNSNEILDQVHLEVFDLNGEKHFTGKVQPSFQNIGWVRQLPSGIYLFRIFGPKNIIETHRVMKI